MYSLLGVGVPFIVSIIIFRGGGGFPALEPKFRLRQPFWKIFIFFRTFNYQLWINQINIPNFNHGSLFGKKSPPLFTHTQNFYASFCSANFNPLPRSVKSLKNSLIFPCWHFDIFRNLHCNFFTLKYLMWRNNAVKVVAFNLLLLNAPGNQFVYL